MRRSLQIITVTVVVLGLLVIIPASSGAADPASELNDSTVLGNQGQQEDESVRVMIVLQAWSSDRASQLREQGASIETRYEAMVQAVVNQRDIGTYRQLPWVSQVYRMPASHRSETVSEGVPAIGADTLHAQGHTGANVTIGIIDQGFDVSNEEIAQNIAEYRSFSTQTGGTEHGTAVAELVMDVAPEAQLYLAEQTTQVEYLNAAEWLATNDVDVIITSVGFFAAPHDGTGMVSRAVTDIVNEGTVWVNAAGNSAQTHWQGNYTDTDGDRWHEFAGDETNELKGLAGTSVQATLLWDDSWNGSANDYDLYLVKRASGTYQSVASSQRPQTGSQRPVETISARIDPSERYYVVVGNYNATGREELELFVDGAQTIEASTARSSLIAPAAAPGSIAVGAFDHSTDTVESFSSAGPTNDGREGIDLLGPDGVTTTAYQRSFYGTSAAAPHVAGTVGVMLGVKATLSPAQTEAILEETTTNKPTTGFDYQRGYGQVNAEQAVERLVTPFTPAVRIDAPDRVRTNTRFNVTVTISNTGTSAGTATLQVTSENQTQVTETITLDGGASVERIIGVTASNMTGTAVTVNATYGTATEQVTVAVGEATVDTYRDPETGQVEISGFRRAIDDFSAGEMNIDTFRAIIDAFVRR